MAPVRVGASLSEMIDAAPQPGQGARSRPPTGAAEVHLSHRAGWLRAAVLGANDGIVSTASLVLGVAAAGESTSAVVTAGIAGLVAGALSMAAGEYVSVSSQRDAEQADIALETKELRADPEGELRELAAIYERRGLSADLARRVAEALSAGGALKAHLRDELGFSEERMARPFQAAWASALSFSAGAVIPLLAIALGGNVRVAAGVVTTILALASLGSPGARLGGAPAARAATRVACWGLIAMGATAAIGALVGTVT